MDISNIFFENKLWHELTDEQRRKIEARAKLAVIKLETRLVHHVPPIEGEYCYFKYRRETYPMIDMVPAARYVCVTSDSTSCGVDFSVSEYVDTKYTGVYVCHGRLESITVDRGMGELWVDKPRMRIE